MKEAHVTLVPWPSRGGEGKKEGCEDCPVSSSVAFANLAVPVTLDSPAGPVELRHASAGDITAILGLLADDPISASRGDIARDDDRGAYESAFHAIDADPSNALLVVVAPAGDVVATMQLTVIPGMARVGATRLQVEAVRVRSDLRSGGIGGAMIRWVTGTAAPAVGASLVQLTSDDARTDAHRFYTRLGFAASHRGFKFTVPT
jgi:GNAT superfamily N-acetyltransferase